MQTAICHGNNAITANIIGEKYFIKSSLGKYVVKMNILSEREERTWLVTFGMMDWSALCVVTTGEGGRFWLLFVTFVSEQTGDFFRI